MPNAERLKNCVDRLAHSATSQTDLHQTVVLKVVLCATEGVLMLELYLFIGLIVAIYNTYNPAWDMSEEKRHPVIYIITFFLAIPLWPIIAAEWWDKRKR